MMLTGSLSAFSHMDTRDLHPQNHGERGRLQSDFARLSQ